MRYVSRALVCGRQTTYLFDLKFPGESSSYQHRSDLTFPSLLSVLVFSSRSSRKNKGFSFHKVLIAQVLEITNNALLNEWQLFH